MAELQISIDDKIVVLEGASCMSQWKGPSKQTPRGAFLNHITL